MRTQNIWLLGLTSIWAHNLFVSWAFEFPNVGGSMLGRPRYPSISSSFSLFLTDLLLCSLSKCLLSSLSTLSRIANPHFFLHHPIYSFRLVEVLWLPPSISANEGPLPLSLGGYLGKWGGSGIGTDSHFIRDVRQWHFLRHYREAGSSCYRATIHRSR